MFDHDHDRDRNHDHDHGRDHDHDHDHDHGHRCRLSRPRLHHHCSFKNVFFSYTKLGLDVCPISSPFIYP